MRKDPMLPSSLLVAMLGSASVVELDGGVVASASDGSLLIRRGSQLEARGPGGTAGQLPILLAANDTAAIAPNAAWVAHVTERGDVGLWASAEGRWVRRAHWPEAGTSFARSRFVDGQLVVFRYDTVSVRRLDLLERPPSCELSVQGLTVMRDSFDLGDALLAVHGDHVDERAGAHRTMPAIIDVRHCVKKGRLSHRERFPAANGGTRVSIGMGELQVRQGDKAFAIPIAAIERARLAVAPDGNRVSVSQYGGVVEVFDLAKGLHVTLYGPRPTTPVLAPFAALWDNGQQVSAASLEGQLVTWQFPGKKEWDRVKFRPVSRAELAWLEALTCLGEGRSGDALAVVEAVGAPTEAKFVLGFAWIAGLAGQESNALLGARLAKAAKAAGRSSSRALLDVLEDFINAELIGNARDLLGYVLHVSVEKPLRRRTIELGLQVLRLGSTFDLARVQEDKAFLQKLRLLGSTPELDYALKINAQELEDLKP